jgi:type IV conjugative transfer system protein TraE
MRFDAYVSLLANLNIKNRVYAFIITVLTIAVVIESFYIAAIGRKQTVIIIPKGLNNTVQVGQEEASEEYLLAMGHYVTFLFLNFDPSTVTANYETLSTLTSSVVQTELFKIAEDYKKNNIASRVVINSIDLTDKGITVKGRRVKYILDRSVEDRSFTLLISYKITFGYFRVQGLEL